MAGLPDPKHDPRVRDAALLRHLHFRWRYCVLCDLLGEEERDPLSLHHVHRHPRDDVEANLVMVCGSGTTGHHGKIEANDRDTLRALATYLRTTRPDFVAYLSRKLGDVVRADAWLARLADGKDPECRTTGS